MPPEITEQDQAIRSDYIAAFSTEQGARVLRHLMNTNFFWDSTSCGDHDMMNQNEGQRKSLLKILGYCQVVGEDAEQIIARRTESISDYVPDQKESGPDQLADF